MFGFALAELALEVVDQLGMLDDIIECGVGHVDCLRDCFADCGPNIPLGPQLV